MDRDLRLQILRASVRDRKFLNSCIRDINPDDFSEYEEQLVCRAAVEFYSKHKEPVSSLLRSEVEDLVGNRKLGESSQHKLKDLIDLVLGPKMELVSVNALVDKVKKLKTFAFYEQAVDNILAANEEGKLDANFLATIVDSANKKLIRNNYDVSEYMDELEERIERRGTYSDKPPSFMIDPLDKRINNIKRGETALWLAPYSSGKGMAMVHMGMAYAMQGQKVLHLPLEDPQTLVEDRYDGAFTGLVLDNLGKLPNRLKKRFKRISTSVRGKIHIVEGRGQQWSIADMERLIEEQRQEGFEADVLLVDYDDYIVSTKKFKGESAKRFEMEDIYIGLNNLAAKQGLFLWTAAQGTRQSEGKKIVTGKDAAEDLNKIRKVFLAIGIGTDTKEQKIKHLYVCRNRDGRSRFPVSICSDFARGIFYDREPSLLLQRRHGLLNGNGNGSH